MAVLEKAEEWHQKGEPWMIDLIKVSPLPSTLEACQRDEQWWKIFKFIAKENYCSENVEFLDQVNEYKRAGNLTMAGEIYNRYIKSGAEKEVNLPSHVQRPLEEIFGEGDGVLAGPDTFDAAYDEIRKLFERDTYATYSRKWDALRDELLLEDMPDDAPKVIGDPVTNAMTRDQVDMSIVDNFNQAALKDLQEGFSTNFWQLNDLVIIDAGMGTDQPYVKWLLDQPGVTRGSNVTMTAKGGAFSSGTVTVEGATDQAAFKAAVARVSKKKVVFK